MATTEDLPERLSSRQVAELAPTDQITLVDVREPHEYEAGHISGARHIPFASLSANAERIDRKLPVVFYCRSGGRSSVATQAFRASGFDAHDMTGGLLDWVSEGLPVEPRDGTVADH